MIRATTPTHKFTFPFNIFEMASDVLITYSQKRNIILNKHMSDLEEVAGEENTYQYKLTQEETNLFEENIDAEIQVRVLSIGGDALASPIYKISINRILNDEVLV